MDSFYGKIITWLKKVLHKKPKDDYNYMFEYDEEGNPIMGKKYYTQEDKR